MWTAEVRANALEEVPYRSFFSSNEDWCDPITNPISKSNNSEEILELDIMKQGSRLNTGFKPRKLRMLYEQKWSQYNVKNEQLLHVGWYKEGTCKGGLTFKNEGAIKFLESMNNNNWILPVNVKGNTGRVAKFANPQQAIPMIEKLLRNFTPLVEELDQKYRDRDARDKAFREERDALNADIREIAKRHAAYDEQEIKRRLAALKGTS